MTNLETLKLPQIKQIEQLRQSNVLVLAASMLEISFLPILYQALNDIGHSQRLDVVLYGRGGEINAARRIGLLLHKFTEQLTFIVPYHCESSYTILALAGHNIIAGDVAIFSPIDPRLNAAESSAEEAPTALASEDIRLFCKMSEDWFGIEGQDGRRDLFSALGGSIFPTTLTSLYRSTLEVKSIAEELLAFQLPDASKRAAIVEQLVSGYHSHSFALSNDDMTQIGLAVSSDKDVEALSWAIACQLEATIGGGVRQTMEDPRNDVLIATRDHIHIRQRFPRQIAAQWLELRQETEQKTIQEGILKAGVTP